MIVNTTVLGRIAAKWDNKAGFFKSDWANIVANWCVRFYKKYGKAPKKSIEGLFENWSSSGGRDKSTVEMVERFLASLSDEYKTLSKGLNVDFLIDEAGRYFNDVKVYKFQEALQADRDSGDIDKALARIHSFGKVELGVGAGIDIFQDQTAVQEAFMEKQEALIKMPDDLGLFFGTALERDGFVAILAPEKRGKTFSLLDLAFRGVLQRRKVAFFEAGDMSQNQIMRRFMSRIANRPIKPGKIQYPKEITKDPDEKIASVVYEEREYNEPLSWQKGWEACQDVMNIKAKSNETLLKLSCHPNSSLNVHGINSILTGWERDGWVPDIIVIDYADILAPMSGVGESRDQINMTWKQLRNLSQSRHCLVVTATQANAASYKADVVGRSHFSEDKRKLAHVTGMFGLNASAEEKKAGILRLNWVVLRENEFYEGKCVHCAGCLAVANPFIKSTF